MDRPWEHPDWYDLHDTTWTAGPEREPEHYRELVLALPPLDAGDHLIDVGAGTGKLAGLIARAYPRLGRVTLVEPNRDKIERARGRMEELLPSARIDAIAAGLASSDELPRGVATVVTVGSVLMPMMELGGGSLGDGLRWLRTAVRELLAMLGPAGWLYCVETLAPPWARGDESGPARRLHMAELTSELSDAGVAAPECVYRFRDRVVLKGRAPS